MWTYIKDNWHSRYQTGQLFDLNRRLARDLRDLHAFEAWDSFFGRHAEFPEGEALLTVVQNMQSFANQLVVNFLSSYPPEVLSIVCIEGCKFMAEISVSGDDARHLPEPELLFSKHVPGIFERLKVPVSGAQWVDKIFKKKTSKASKDKDDDGNTTTGVGGPGDQDGADGPQPQGKGKGRGRGKAKAKSKPKPKAKPEQSEPQEERNEVLADVKMDMADRRQKWWLDDLICCLVRASNSTLDALRIKDRK